MTMSQWIESHPYLAGVADFERMLDAALDAAELPSASVPDAEVYAAELEKGTPMLLGAAAPDLAAAAEGLRKVVEVLATEELPEGVKEQVVEFRDLSRETPQHATSAIEWVVAPDGDEQDHPAVIRLLAWRVLRRMLMHAVVELAPVRDKVLWPRSECPTCGSVASLAQLVEVDNGRKRMLVCACCNTSWQYKRVGCPYCENDSQDSLSILEIETEPQHRLDLCARCHGYTKTMLGGDPFLFYADWPTLHLDMLAVEKGYRRAGASLYDVSGPETVQ